MQNKIKAIIVDDESKSRDALRKLLTRFAPEVELVGESADVEAAYDLIVEANPDLIFLDIQMPRSSGFNLLKKFKEISFEVIFVTSFDKYAINAIKFSALDYLLKPVDIKELKESIARAKKHIDGKKSFRSRYITLFDNLDDNSKEKKVSVHNGDMVELISSKDILYIEADGSYCMITTLNSLKYTTAKFLKDFEDFFGEQSDFVRIHKSCLINTKHVTGYTKGEPCFVKMSDGNSFEISRRRKQEVLEKIK